MRSLRFALSATFMSVGMTSAPSAGATPAATPAATCRMHAPEAAVRSGVAIDVLLRVMRAESGGNVSVVSAKGAIGCMQLMPVTWRYLSRRYSLGVDPYDARMNMIAGAMYLADLGRRFGWPGAYAAYNAGEARYMRHVTTGAPLPEETAAYVARLGGAAAPAIAAVPRSRWQEARLFLVRTAEATGAFEPQDGRSVSASSGRRESLDAHDVPSLFPLSSDAAPVGR